MPEMNESEVPTTSQTTGKRRERTEAKFFEDVDRMIAESERLGAGYDPPNKIATVTNLKAKREAALTGRAAHQTNKAAEETTRNDRENLYKQLSGDVTSLVVYVRSAGKLPNEIAALQTIARKVKGGRAKPIEPNDNGHHISVSNLSYVTRADNYAQFIEQYDALGIATNEDPYKAATHRARLAALQQANQNVIAAESNSATSGEALDKLVYTDADSLLNACVSAKNYIKSKYKVSGEPYKNIAKTRFELPTRLRRK
jgi:cytochrome c556